MLAKAIKNIEKGAKVCKSMNKIKKKLQRYANILKGFNNSFVASKVG